MVFLFVVYKDKKTGHVRI